MRPRDYQEGALRAVTQAIRAGIRAPVVVLPTGTGKTATFAWLLQRRDRDQPGHQHIVLENRDELCEQTSRTVKLIWPTAHVGMVKAERDETDAQVVVASAQTLANPRRLERFHPDRVATVVVDEAHHGAAPTYCRILEYFRNAARPGFTATPVASMRKVFDRIVYRKELLEMIQRQVLCRVTGMHITTDVDLSGVRITNGDLDAEDLACLLNTRNRNHLIVAAWKEHARSRLTIAFCCTVQHARDLAAEFEAQGVRAAAIWGEMPKRDRKRILQDLTARRLQVVANCATLTEGFDEPQVDCLVLARPTKSKVLFVQILGRGLRRHPAKDDCLVLDFAGASRSHSLWNLATLFGGDDLQGAAAPPEVITIGPDGVREGPRAGPTPAEETGPLGIGIRADRVNLFEQAQDAASTSGFRWFVRDTDLQLSLGPEGWLVLAPKDDGYMVVHRCKGREKIVLDRPVPLTWAQGAAEDYARSTLGKATVLVQRSAAWRDKPPSPEQLKILSDLGLEHMEFHRRGEVADLISLYQIEKASGASREEAVRRALARLL